MEINDIQSEGEKILTDNLLCNLSGNQVVIDCGHTPLGISGQELLFGRNGSPSETELLTLQIGVNTLNRLKGMGKDAKLSICFSDTTRFFRKPEKRAWVKEMCESGDIIEKLPEQYRDILKNVTSTDCFFTLQTVNSNRFTRIIKKVKKDIRSAGSSRSAYKKYNVLFARDNIDTLFCFTNEYLLNTTHENNILDGDWWLDEFSTLHPSDISNAPIAPLKKFGIISLYSRKTGILCPATYGGLISNFGENVDHIAIYSRNDDPSIGEKIIRGIVSTCVLSMPQLQNKNFLQVILNSDKKTGFSKYAEVSLISASDVNTKEFSYEELTELFKKRLSYRYKNFL